MPTLDLSELPIGKNALAVNGAAIGIIASIPTTSEKVAIAKTAALVLLGVTQSIGQALMARAQMNSKKEVK